MRQNHVFTFGTSFRIFCNFSSDLSAEKLFQILKRRWWSRPSTTLYPTIIHHSALLHNIINSVLRYVIIKHISHKAFNFIRFPYSSHKKNTSVKKMIKTHLTHYFSVSSYHVRFVFTRLHTASIRPFGALRTTLIIQPTFLWPVNNSFSLRDEFEDIYWHSVRHPSTFSSALYNLTLYIKKFQLFSLYHRFTVGLFL